MRASTVSRSLLLAAAGSAALAGAAMAQSTSAPATVEDVIVTGAPYGVSQRAAVIATDVLDEQTLATAPAASPPRSNGSSCCSTTRRATSRSSTACSTR